MTPDEFQKKAKKLGYIQHHKYEHIYRKGSALISDTDLQALIEEMEAPAPVREEVA